MARHRIATSRLITMAFDQGQLDLILAHQIAARARTDADRDVVTFENGNEPDEVRTYAQLWATAGASPERCKTRAWPKAIGSRC